MDDKEMLGKVKDVLFDVAILLDKCTVKKDMESLRRLHYALQNKIRDLGLGDEYYDKVFFPVSMLNEETRTVRLGGVDEDMKKEKAIIDAIAKMLDGDKEEGK